MTPTEAAKYIGCSPQHVRYLIRAGKLKAKKVKVPHINNLGYRYEIEKEEAKRFKKAPVDGRGWPRGKARDG